MKETIYTPEQLVKNWLPDYKTRREEHINEMETIAKHSRVNVMSYEMIDDFILKHFHEALEAFAEAQREECAKVELGTYDWCKVSGEMFIKQTAILNAPMPKPINNNKIEK